MTIKIRKWKKGKQGKKVSFEVDIRLVHPDGTLLRQRVKAPVTSESAATRWGEARARELLMRPSPKVLLQQQAERKEAPTLAEFYPRFINEYARANRHKASGIASKESILAQHLVPMLGTKRLNEISDELIQRLKANLATKKPKTVNNVLTVLNMLLKTAVEWKVIDAMPCRIKLLKVSNLVPHFYEFAEYERLVDAAAAIDLSTLLVVLLGGDAGLRRSEIIGLRWCDVDFKRKLLVIEQAVWKGIVDTPKSGHGRIIPMTDALAAALHRHRHLRGPRVLYTDEGQPATDKILRRWVTAAKRRAQLPLSPGALHILEGSQR
jgi:integrase